MKKANRIDTAFKRLRREGEKAFIAFITAGYPDMKATAQLIHEFERQGVDIIELGVPFSDPLADGPVIQESSQKALEKGTTLAGILSTVRKVRQQGCAVPLCLMTYYNPVFSYGDERFMKNACAAGVDGVIIPDLPMEEGRVFMRAAQKAGLYCIRFIAPTTSSERIASISKGAKGFIYYVSLTGVTGMRASLPSDMRKHIAAIKNCATVPVCAGFGVSTAGQVRQVASIADGVIVGSAIVAEIRKYNGTPDMVKRVGRFVRSLFRMTAFLQ
jgi:tryptophan synthase alpha chain